MNLTPTSSVTPTAVQTASRLLATVRGWWVTAHRISPAANRRDDGSITLWVAATFMAVLAVAGLVIDGGAKIRAGERADEVASEAVRAASFANGPDNITRTAAAATAARGILTRSGLTGNVTVAGPGQVDIAVQASTAGPISGYTYTVTRNAQAQILLGLRTGDTP